MATLTASVSAKAAAVKRGLAAPISAPAQKSPVPAPAVYPPSPVNPLATPEPTPPDPSEPKAPSKKQRARAEFLERQRQAREHLLPLLSGVSPECFRVPSPPLAVGIHRQILEVDDSIDPRELGVFLRYWCSRNGYKLAIWRGDPRLNLDGSVASVPTIAERNCAGRSVYRERYREIPEPVVEAVQTAPMAEAALLAKDITKLGDISV